jgi:hypothetical protein
LYDVQKGWRLMEMREWKCGGWDVVELITDHEGRKEKLRRRVKEFSESS